MNITKRISLFLLSTIIALLPVFSFAESIASESTESLIITGSVITGNETAIISPISGQLDSFTLRVGDKINIGDSLFTLKTTKVYAKQNGTVKAIFAQPGDDMATISNQYGGLLAIEPENRLILNCNTGTGYNNNEVRDIHIGDTVYIRNRYDDKDDDEDEGVGRIISVDNENFTVEITEGDLAFKDTVNVYKTVEYEYNEKLAGTKVSAKNPVLITGAGTLVNINTKIGSKIKKGDLLYSYVSDILAPNEAIKNDVVEITAQNDIIISKLNATQAMNVQKDQVLALVCNSDDLQISIEVEENDLSRFMIGKVLNAVFENTTNVEVETTVAGISYLGSNEDTSKYTVYLDFDVPAGILPGMHATVTID